MNLAYHYPSIYWATAVMTVEAGALDIEDSTGTNYVKVATAIARAKTEGYKIELPSINKANFAFTPDSNNNSIIYGLKGISEINDDFIKVIIKNRPYKSLLDFIEKTEPQKKQVINLIKAGAFNDFGNPTEIMKEYLKLICPQKTHITLQNMNTLIKYNLIDNDLITYIYLYNFNKYLKQLETPDGFKLDKRAIQFMNNNFPELECDIFLDKKIWKKTYDKKMEYLKKWIGENEETLIVKIQEKEMEELQEQYFKGDEKTWEMESLGFYSSDHELSNVKLKTSSITELDDGSYKNTVNIAGTVLGKDAYKHMVYLLTPDGVITLKMTKDIFANYNRIISEIKNGEKTVLEKSWFLKGTLLYVNGYKSGEVFRVRNISKILLLNKDGDCKTTKYRIDEV